MLFNTLEFLIFFLVVATIYYAMGGDFTIISHPKLFTPSAIANLEKFVKEIKSIEYKLFE